MNIYKFSKDKDFDKEYKYKVLVYPNITYMRDLEKDSYVVVLRNVIKELNKVRDDIHWTILSPWEVRSLIFPNTTQLPIELPSYPNAMRLLIGRRMIMMLSIHIYLNILYNYLICLRMKQTSIQSLLDIVIGLKFQRIQLILKKC